MKLLVEDETKAADLYTSVAKALNKEKNDLFIELQYKTTKRIINDNEEIVAKPERINCIKKVSVQLQLR